jgi:hypothetical protein
LRVFLVRPLRPSGLRFAIFVVLASKRGEFNGRIDEGFDRVRAHTVVPLVAKAQRD